MARTLPLLPLLLLTALAAASFLQCDDHLGSCEPEAGPAHEPVLARLLPAGAEGADVDAASVPATAESGRARREAKDRAAAADSANTVTSQPVGDSKREAETHSGISSDASKRQRSEETPVVPTKKQQQASKVEDLPKTPAGNFHQHAKPAASVTKPPVPKNSDVTQKTSKQPPSNKVEVPVQRGNVDAKTEEQPTLVAENSRQHAKPVASEAKPPVQKNSNVTQKTSKQPPSIEVEVSVQRVNVAAKTEEQRTVVASESATRKKREIVSDIPGQKVAVASRKSDNAAGQKKGVQTESSRGDTSKKSASEGQRKSVETPVISVPAGAKEATSKPSTSNVNSAQDLLSATIALKESQKQGKHVTEKQNRQQKGIQHTDKPEVPKRDSPKNSPASSGNKANANDKHQSVKSQSTADNGAKEGMPKTSKQSQSHGNDQKEAVKRFRSSEESHGDRKIEKTHPVKSQGSHQQENLQGEIRKSTGSAEGKDVSQSKSKSVAALNKISSDIYKEKVKDPNSKLSDVDMGEYDTDNSKVIASMLRNTQKITKVKNNETSQLKQEVKMQDEKQRVKREIRDHSTFSVTSESSQMDTDHYREMRLNESVKNATVKKATISNRSASLDDSFKTASTTIIVEGNLFKGPGSKTWKLSSLTNTSENEVDSEVIVEKKSTKWSGSSFAESKRFSAEKSNSSGNHVNANETDKSSKHEESPEVPIIVSSQESVLKSTPLSKPESTKSGIQIKQAPADLTDSTQDKSMDVTENHVQVCSDQEAPVSSPSRGETTLRIKRDTTPEKELSIRNEIMRDETPALVEDAKTDIKAEKESQEKETKITELQEVTKSEEDNENAAALLKGVKSEKTVAIDNGTDSRNEPTTDQKQEELVDRKSEASKSSDPLHVPDTGINTNESATKVPAASPNEKIPKGEPVSQRLVSVPKQDDSGKESKPLTQPAATENSGSTDGKGEISLMTTERNEEPKEVVSTVISDTSTEISCDSETDTPALVDGTDAAADAGKGEPERGGPVSEAMVSLHQEVDGPNGDPLQAEPRAETGESLADAVAQKWVAEGIVSHHKEVVGHNGDPLQAEPRAETSESLADAVAQKWVVPEPSGRSEERRDEAVQPQEEVEESERLLLLADQLRQRGGGGRRDVEDARDLDEPQLHFPSVPNGEDFHAAKLGLSDGIFLFGYLSTFISWLQPNDFPVELVRDALWNRVSLTDLMTETLQVEVGFIAVLSVGVALALALPLTALGVTCCRLVEARADCRDHEPSVCRRRSLLCGLWTVLLLMAVGVAAMFASNEQVSAAVRWSPRVLHTALSDTAAFVRSTHHQIGFVASKSLDQALAAAIEDLDNADALLGAPIQRELSRETGLDVALDALSDVSAAAEAASQRAAAALEQAAQARGLALVARERLADLRYQLDAARRQCAARDRPLCDTVDAVGLDVSVRLETLLSDERLLALRDLRNGNLSAAAQQARADFQLLPRQVLETTRDARLGIRRELVRERAHLQEALTPLDSFSRSVSGRVDGARAAAQHAATVLQEADYWRWLAGLGATLSMLVIWLLLAAGGGCGCCGSQEKARPLLITAVATASVLSVLLWSVTLAAFALGAHGEVLACRPLFSAPDYPQLSRLLDRPGALFHSGGFFRNVAGSNASLDVPLKDVLQECELGRPAYEALQLRQLFDSDAATGGGGQWEGVRQQVSRLRVDLQELRVLTPGLQAHLQDTLRAASANLTQHRVALQGPVTNRDLQALADQLLSVSSQVTDLSSASRLETLAARAKRLLSSHIAPLEQRKEDLVYQLTALEVALQPLQRQTNQSLSHLKTIQYFVGQQGESIARAATRRYADRLLGYLRQARDHVQAQVGRHVANCRPLFDVFHAARQLLCRHAVDPLNGLWFSSAWCLVLLVAAVPLSLRLADAYRRRDSSASLLSSRNSESPSETVDIPDNWNSPGGGQQQQDGW